MRGRGEGVVSDACLHARHTYMLLSRFSCHTSHSGGNVVGDKHVIGGMQFDKAFSYRVIGDVSC